MRITAVVALFADLPEAELTGWVARGWVRPDRGEAGLDFHEIDVARIRLIHDLHRTMDIGEETMPVILSLLDQIYDLRGTLRDLLLVLETQPDDVRTTVLAALRRG